MEKLTAIDASFLYSETGSTNSNVASVDVLQLPTEVTSSAFVATLKEYMLERLHLSPYLHRKLAFVPWNLDHPSWIHDESIDIDNHVIEVPVPLPGDQAAMEAVVAELHAAKMPLDRPLWAMYVLTGLEGNKVAYYNQIHHAAIDGASGNAAYDILMDETPEHPPVEAPAGFTDERPSQLALSLVEQATANFFRFQLDTPLRLMGALETGARLARRTARNDLGTLGRLAPETRFNKQISAHRTWAGGEMPMADLKKMKTGAGVTINDIVLAVCAGGLRTYLDRIGQMPGKSLIAGCPVSLREPGDTKPGNQVTMMTVDLATTTDNPVERLYKIHQSAITAKGLVQDLAGIYENNASVPGLPMIMKNGLQTLESVSAANFLRNPVNVVISNVPGPRTTRYSNGARLLAHYPVSIPTHGLGLNITVQTYEDTMFVGVTACRKALPDATVLVEDLIAAFRELRSRLLGADIHELIRPERQGISEQPAPNNQHPEDPEREMVA